MKAVIVEPMEKPIIKDIENSLESLQEIVGGYIQVIEPFDDAAIICNEEGKLRSLPLNRALKNEDGSIYDILCGTFIISGLTEEDFGDLTDEQAEYYCQMYEKPEQFIMQGSRIISITD